jgi:hypothetical protein
MLARSMTFRIAFSAVGEHTPPEQLMFCVAFVDISTEARALEITSGRQIAASSIDGLPEIMATPGGEVDLALAPSVANDEGTGEPSLFSRGAKGDGLTVSGHQVPDFGL